MIAALFSVERMQKLSSEMRGKRQREGGRRSGVLVTYRSYMHRLMTELQQKYALSLILTQCASTDVIVDGNPPAFLRNLT